jgi:hypothetical protein
MAKKKRAPKLVESEGAESLAENVAEVIHMTPVVGELMEEPDRSIGWTLELTVRLNWLVSGRAQEFHALALEIDSDAGHFVAGLVAVAHGDYDLAALNLHKAGMLEQAPSVVEESEE